MAYNEEKHKRDKSGKWTGTGDGGAQTPKKSHGAKDDTINQLVQKPHAQQISGEQPNPLTADASKRRLKLTPTHSSAGGSIPSLVAKADHGTYTAAPRADTSKSYGGAHLGGQPHEVFYKAKGQTIPQRLGVHSLERAQTVIHEHDAAAATGGKYVTQGPMADGGTWNEKTGRSEKPRKNAGEGYANYFAKESAPPKDKKYTLEELQAEFNYAKKYHEPGNLLQIMHHKMVASGVTPAQVTGENWRFNSATQQHELAGPQTHITAEKVVSTSPAQRREQAAANRASTAESAITGVTKQQRVLLPRNAAVSPQAHKKATAAAIAAGTPDNKSEAYKASVRQQALEANKRLGLNGPPNLADRRAQQARAAQQYTPYMQQPDKLKAAQENLKAAQDGRGLPPHMVDQAVKYWQNEIAKHSGTIDATAAAGLPTRTPADRQDALAALRAKRNAASQASRARAKERAAAATPAGKARKGKAATKKFIAKHGKK